MMEKKVTKKEMFKKVVEMATKLGEEDVAIFANHEIELLENKKSTPTATQKANVDIKDKIVKVMKELNKAVTITELLNADQDLKDMVAGSQNKLTALVTQLKNENVVIRTVDKKKAYFKIA